MNHSNRYLKRLNLLLIFLMIVWGCESGRVLQSTGNQDDAIKDTSGFAIKGVPIYVDSFVKNAKKYENQMVSVRGIFMGWKGSCKVPPPETRSDWMIEYEGACVYVSGPTPLGIDITPSSNDIGKEIEIYGRALLDKSGDYYIKIIDH